MTAADRPSVPRVGDVLTTAEQLDALWDLQDVLINASGTYANGMGTFTECWARPVPEFVGGALGTWEVLVFGDSVPANLTLTSKITRATVLYVPVEPSESGERGVGTGAGEVDDPAPTEATSWVTRSTDCPEAPAQAHPHPAAGRAETTTEHEHDWKRQRSVTSKGYELPTIEVCQMAGCDAARPAETTTATDEDAEAAVVDALGQSPFAHHESNPCGETFSTLSLHYDDDWYTLAASIVQTLHARALLATARTRPTRDDISDAIEHSGIAIGTSDAEQAADAVLALLDGGER